LGKIHTENARRLSEKIMDP